ncbi:hypothetical protein BM221_000736 [Beauveria bassiana]|uniref:Uncharacterized protein n=1 Tax=Beauveria bassiana TaxID=176275 RepID=A0A2N6P1C1_BEABA|nr:hypothetical protein BM221_000736 [Beauveria bassiana]
MSTKRNYDIYVAVFKGIPMDFCKFRHTGLWFYPDEGTEECYVHVVGLTGEFEFETRLGWDPANTVSFAKKVKVGTTKRSLTTSELVALSQSIPVENRNPEFNCQQWVQRALLALFKNGYITEEEYNNGVNGMIDATMEAEDETLP